MKKKEAMIKTLADGTRVRRSNWLPSHFVYYCQKSEKPLWQNGQIYSAFACNMEEDGWEVYREEIVAKGVAELFEKHKEIGKPNLLWKVDTFSMVRSSCFTPSDPGRILLYWQRSGEPVHLNSQIIGKTFTLLDDAGEG